VTRPTTRRPTARGSNAPAPGAKTARGLATQAALVRAAQTVFERDGFLDARIADITATAGTATGSFYTYFNGKEEIFLAVVAALDEVGLHPPTLAYLTERHADAAALAADIATHHRAYLETYHRNAKMMRVVEEVTNITAAFRRERTARAQPWIADNSDAVRRPRPRPRRRGARAVDHGQPDRLHHVRARGGGRRGDRRPGRDAHTPLDQRARAHARLLTCHYPALIVPFPLTLWVTCGGLPP
jgi:AcrR family transcriptional regulator